MKDINSSDLTDKSLLNKLQDINNNYNEDDYIVVFAKIINNFVNSNEGYKILIENNTDIFEVGHLTAHLRIRILEEQDRIFDNYDFIKNKVIDSGFENLNEFEMINEIYNYHFKKFPLNGLIKNAFEKEKGGLSTKQVNILALICGKLKENYLFRYAIEVSRKGLNDNIINTVNFVKVHYKNP